MDKDVNIDELVILVKNVKLYCYEILVLNIQKKPLYVITTFATPKVITLSE
jgi:hypothetical protein